MSDATRMQPRRLRVLLRDYRMLEAGLALPSGQSLISFLAGRKTYLTLHDATWLATGERVEPVAVRADRILWIAIVDDELPLVNGRMTAEPRAVEVLLEGGMLLTGGLSLAPVQRLPDYLESAGSFIAIRDATLVRSGRPSQQLGLAIGDVALNHEAIQAAWEVDSRGSTTHADAVGADAGAFPDLSTSDGQSHDEDDSPETITQLEGLEAAGDFDLADIGSDVESLLDRAPDADGVDGDTLADVDFGFSADLADAESEDLGPSSVVLGIDDHVDDDDDQDRDRPQQVIHRSDGWV